MKSHTSIGQRSGLTLVELVVVLVILVIVAGTALTASGSLVDEAHYESTQAELRNLESALLGHYDSASHDEDDAISFVADVGRLPRVASAPPGGELAELWIPSGLVPFAIQSPAGDLDVRLPGGWRGPYLRLGFGGTKLVDGWGRAYPLLAADDTVALPTTELRKIRSLGANGIEGGADYDADATLDFESSLPNVLAARHLGAVPVRVHNTSVTGEFIVVRIYGPQDGAIVTLGQSAAVPASGADVVHTFVNVPVGPRVVRAYRTATTPATENAPFEGGTVRSPIRAITVVQGGIAEIELELP